MDENERNDEGGSAVDEGRRGLGRLLAMLGGSALLSSCVTQGGAGAEDEGAAVQSAVSTTNVVKVADAVADLAGLQGATAGATFADVVILKGARDVGDGGGGVFVWLPIPTGTDPTNWGTIVRPTGVTSGYWKRVYSGAINVKWFAKLAPYTPPPAPVAYDWTAAIQAAIDATPVNGGAVFFPRSDGSLNEFVITGTLRVKKHNVTLAGEVGGGSVIFLFPQSGSISPYNPVIAIDVRIPLGADPHKYAGRIIGCTIRDLTIGLAQPSTIPVVGIRLMDPDQCIVERVIIGGGGVAWSTGPDTRSGVGIQLLGGQACQLRDLFINAPHPIEVGKAYWDGSSNWWYRYSDQMSFRNLMFNTDYPANEYTGTGSAAGIFIDGDMVLQNFELDGSSNHTGGRHFIYWKEALSLGSWYMSGVTDQVNTQPSTLVRIGNHRVEGSRRPTSTALLMLAPQGRSALDFTVSKANLANANGIVAQNISYLTVNECCFQRVSSSAQYAIQVLGGVGQLAWHACSMLNTAASIGQIQFTLTGLTLRWEVPHPLAFSTAPAAYYTT